MFALPISMPRFVKASFFYQNSPKIKLFLQKNAKFSSAGGFSPWLPDPQFIPPPPQLPIPGCAPVWVDVFIYLFISRQRRRDGAKNKLSIIAQCENIKMQTIYQSPKLLK